jgi:hypothetical protein
LKWKENGTQQDADRGHWRGEIEEAKKLIQSVHPKHPFDEKYNRVADIDWETCSIVLNADETTKILLEKCRIT